MSDAGGHVLVFPYPAHGHMIALLDLTLHLAARGAAVTVIVTPKNLRFLSPLIAAHPEYSITPLVFPLPPHPSIPAGVENTVDLPPSGFLSMMVALSGLRDPLIRWFRSHPSPPSAIISDMFVGWASGLAADLGVRNYAFFPSGAFAISFIRSLWTEMPGRPEGGDGELVGFPEIPYSPIYPWWQLSPVYRSYVKGNPDSEFIKGSYLGNFASYGLVFNSFDGLESVHVDYLCKKLGHDRVWAVGPLLPPDEAGAAERGGSTSALTGEICSWLDTCQDRSVVYVCFGSQAVLTNEQMRELTSGLEKSGVNFILSVKGAVAGQDGNNYGSVPDGFEDRVAGRGLVIKGWAPQVPILKHKAVRAFLTHCGWNSTLESIIAGVPMLAWPMGADQYLNATLLVEQLDVAIRVCDGPATVLGSDDLIRFLEEVKSEKWSETRGRAAALSKAALDAVRAGGSSFKNLDDLAKVLAEK